MEQLTVRLRKEGERADRVFGRMVIVVCILMATVAVVSMLLAVRLML